MSSMWNPFRRSSDTTKRDQLRKEVMQLINARCTAKGSSCQFEDLKIDDPTDERAGIIAVLLEEIVKADPTLALFMWPGGPAIVRVKDYNDLSEDMQAANQGFFITADKVKKSQ